MTTKNKKQLGSSDVNIWRCINTVLEPENQRKCTTGGILKLASCYVTAAFLTETLRLTIRSWQTHTAGAATLSPGCGLVKNSKNSELSNREDHEC